MREADAGAVADAEASIGGAELPGCQMADRSASAFALPLTPIPRTHRARAKHRHSVSRYLGNFDT
jgi:hypothetical protein